MKFLLRSRGPVLALILPFLIVGCGEDEPADPPEEPTKKKTTKSRPKSRPGTAPSGERSWEFHARRIQNLIMDYWAPDEETLLNDFKKQLTDAGVPADQLEEAVRQYRVQAQNSAVHIEKDKITLILPGSSKVRTYTPTGAEAKDNLLLFEGLESDRKYTGSAKVEGDDLVLSKGKGEVLPLVRIDESEYLLRVENSKEAGKPSGLPPIPIPIPTPPVPGEDEGEEGENETP